MFSYCPTRREQVVTWPKGVQFVIGVSGQVAEKTGDKMAGQCSSPHPHLILTSSSPLVTDYNDASLLAKEAARVYCSATGTDHPHLAAVCKSASNDADAIRAAIRKHFASGGKAAFTEQQLLVRFDQFFAESEELVAGVAHALQSSDWPVSNPHLTPQLHPILTRSSPNPHLIPQPHLILTSSSRHPNLVAGVYGRRREEPSPDHDTPAEPGRRDGLPRKQREAVRRHRRLGVRGGLRRLGVGPREGRGCGGLHQQVEGGVQRGIPDASKDKCLLSDGPRSGVPLFFLRFSIENAEIAPCFRAFD